MKLFTSLCLLMCFWINVPAFAAERKIQVVTSLFPLYDFARQVGGDKVEVSLLLPPGVEAHDFEPKPGDMIKINRADIFIFTGKFMEPWTANLTKGSDNQSLLVLDASQGIILLKDRAEEKGVDPHIWLDLANAQKMVNTIAGCFKAKDPANSKFYQDNSLSYNKQLQALDREYQAALAKCRQKVMISGGHFAFGYLAKRYNLQYQAAYRGFGTDAEPTVRDLLDLINKIKKYQVKYIFYEELINPKVANTLAQETGAGLLKLNSAHNLTRDEWEKGVTFLTIMAENLITLKVGLSCQ